LVVYLPVVRDSFSGFDDDDYVTENHIIQNGLTWDGIKWAFITWHASNWHPLTWISHMLDCELFGLNAGAQHYVNVLFHTINAVLLLLLLFRMTGALWPSAFIAALFAWHPLHVESVAWIAERKDVLSTFFEMLALLAYARFVTESKVRSPKSKVFYALALLMFALGLMSKPMLVTLPFVLLLLDYWPLQRFPDSKLEVKAVSRLMLEKWPFFLLAIASCIVTFLAQRNGGMVVTLQQFSPGLRLGNALLSYVLYLGKAVWPAKLSVNYPLQNQLSWAEVETAVIFLAAIMWLAWRARRQHPYLLVGWLWFLGMLVPVIGLVQVGSQVSADRYTYVPLIGIFIAAAFGIKDLIARFQIGVVPPAVAASLLLGSCLVLTEHQLSYWRNDETLFKHAIVVTKDNCFAHYNLGVTLERQGRQVEALTNYQETIRINPDWAWGHNTLGNLLDNTGNPEEALIEYRKAMQLNPNLPVVHDNIGIVLTEFGRFDEAMSQFKEAARLDPTYPWAYWEMGKALLKLGRDAEAIDRFREALRLDPNNCQTLAYTAHVLAAAENPEVRDGKTALLLAAKANALTGGIQPSALDALGMACAELGRFKEAQQVQQRAIEIAIADKVGKSNLELLLQRLELYKKHQPWRESFLFTNTSPRRNLPKN
jgi:tetratricopeptide (TPR) repeat protein